MSEPARLVEISDDDVARIRASWPACVKILGEAIEKMEDELEKAASSDAAYNIINSIMLREVFLRKTIAAVIDRDCDDVLGWVEEEWDDWDE